MFAYGGRDGQKKEESDMNDRDRNTRRITAASYQQRQPLASASIRAKKRRKRRIITSILVSLITLLLTTALVILIVQTAKRRAENPPVGPGSGTGQPAGTTGESPDRHGPEMALDGNDATYFESDTAQRVNNYYMISLETEADVMYVDVTSNHGTRYLRAADVQVSSDSTTWKNIGTYTGSPDSASPVRVTAGYSVRASYIRLLLTEDSDQLWVLNSITAYDNDGTVLKARSGSTGYASPASSTTGSEQITTSSPDGYLRIELGYSDLHSGDLILVGPSNPYIFPTSTASILRLYENRTQFTDAQGKTVYALQIGDVELTLLEARVLVRLNAMADAFYKETGITKLHVGTNGGYRSRETQAELAAKYSNAAAAGYSDHNTGLSANLDIFDSGSVYQLGDAMNADAVRALTWITQNAASYGFIERFPPAKYSVTGVKDDFHYRYVGVPHAWYMSENNLVLEEYLAFLEKNARVGENSLKFTACDGKNYEVWFVPVEGEKTRVPVPEGREYTVSGNNYNGFIVTAIG